MSSHGSSRKGRADNAKVIAASEVCAICGGHVDKSLRTPHPMSPEVDHKVAVINGGSDTLDNKQLAHRKCNRAKWHRASAPIVRRSGALR